MLRRTAQLLGVYGEVETVKSRIKSYIEGRMGKKQTSAGPAAEAGIADQLAKLVQLKDQGVLSDEEFARTKDRVLSAARTSTPTTIS